MVSFARYSTSTIHMPVELASPTILLRLKCKWSIFIVSHRIVNSVACFRCTVGHSVLCKYFAVVSCCWWIEIRMDYIGQCSNSSSSPTYFVRKMFLLWWNHSFLICAWHTAHTHTYTRNSSIDIWWNSALFIRCQEIRISLASILHGRTSDGCVWNH